MVWILLVILLILLAIIHDHTVDIYNKVDSLEKVIEEINKSNTEKQEPNISKNEIYNNKGNIISTYY